MRAREAPRSSVETHKVQASFDRDTLARFEREAPLLDRDGPFGRLELRQTLRDHRQPIFEGHNFGPGRLESRAAHTGVFERDRYNVPGGIGRIVERKNGATRLDRKQMPPLACLAIDDEDL